MYAKLFASITDSSLMGCDVETRYTFMMLLAIADPVGDIVATDEAISRKIAMPLDRTEKALADLNRPDPKSNSPVDDGRRIVPIEDGRGWHIVNFEFYDGIRKAAQRSSYMTTYLRKWRAGEVGSTAHRNKILAENSKHGDGEKIGKHPRTSKERRQHDTVKDLQENPLAQQQFERDEPVKF
jgi:hypothetical protein